MDAAERAYLKKIDATAGAVVDADVGGARADPDDRPARRER